MSAYYYHKQVMEDRGITTQDLPENLRKYILTFQRKVNFLKDPEKIRELQEFSQILGEKIAETEIKKKASISDLTNELQNETILPQTEPVSYEKGGEIKSVEEQIKEYSKKQAKKLGVIIKPSKVKGKKIDVFKNNKKLVSIGALGYKDYPTYIKEKGKKYADERRRLYKIRHSKDRKIRGSAGYYADKILW